MGTLLKTNTYLTSQNILYNIKVAAAVLFHQTMIVSVLSMIINMCVWKMIGWDCDREGFLSSP